MLAIILFLLMGPPNGYGAGVTLNYTVRESFPERAACHLWWSETEHKCRDEDVQVIGPWDPRPSPDEWPANNFDSKPPDFGTYPTEQHVSEPDRTIVVPVPASFPEY